MKKILYKNLKPYEDIRGLSAAMLYAWDRLTKKIHQQFDQWQMQSEKLAGGGGHIAYLI